MRYRPAPARLFEGNKVFQDDFVTITLRISGEMAYRVYHYLATFGEHCEILAPEDIRRQIKSKLQKTLQQYL